MVWEDVLSFEFDGDHFGSFSKRPVNVEGIGTRRRIAEEDNSK